MSVPSPPVPVRAVADPPAAHWSTVVLGFGLSLVVAVVLGVALEDAGLPLGVRAALALLVAAVFAVHALTSRWAQV